MKSFLITTTLKKLKNFFLKFVIKLYCYKIHLLHENQLKLKETKSKPEKL